MSSSSEIIDAGKFSGQKPAKSPEKSSFSQTCSMLSQYLKEKRTLGDLSLGIGFESNGSYLLITYMIISFYSLREVESSNLVGSEWVCLIIEKEISFIIFNWIYLHAY